MKLKGKVALITGGGNGLGKEACLLFAKEGATVLVADFNQDAATVTASLINADGGIAYPLQVDVSQAEQVDKMVKVAITLVGTIDILVNNAGVTKDATLLKMTDSQWEQVIGVNQTGVFLMTKAVAPYMVAQGSGKIINTSSIVGKMGNFGQTNYAATKAAVIAMTQTWAKELGRKGINVNAVAPGFIETDMTKQMPAHVLDGMREKVSLQRLGKPSDIAEAYLFLASGSSDYINGTTLSVDGGLSI